MIRVAMEATGIRRDWKEVAQMGFDTGNGGRVRSYVTHAAMGGCGPMIGIPVESTNELLIMDEAEPVQGAIDEYACDLVDRGRYRDSVLATIELDRGGLFQDWQKRGEELRLKREDVTVGQWRVHAVFEGMRYGLGDKLIYGCDPGKRNPETGLPENDCQTEENKGLPLIEFYLDDDDGPLSGLPVATIPAARLLGLDDAAADARKVGLTNRSYPLVAGQEEPALGPREAIGVGRWVEDITKFRFEAHRDPAAFGQMMADRYDLLYETEGLLESHEDVAAFDAVNGKGSCAAIGSVVNARGDLIASDRDAMAFAQVLDALTAEVEQRASRRVAECGLADLEAQARASAEARSRRGDEHAREETPAR